MTTHVDNIITGCAHVLYGLCTLRSHGMPPLALHAVFQSTVMAKVTYVAPAWWGFTNAVDRNRLEAVSGEQLTMATAPTLHQLLLRLDII